MIVFLISGLWHGANWTFVIWGGLHGSYYLFSYWTRNIRPRLTRMLKLDKVPFLHNYRVTMARRLKKVAASESESS